MGANFVRSVLAAGVATITVGASALSAPPSTPDTQRISAAPAVSLTALSKPLPPVTAVPVGLGSLESEVLEFVEANSINSAIKNIYNAVEPWVEWGFEVAQYVVGWIPIAGYFAPQITILYTFGESIVQSVVFNLDDWIFGPLPFFDGLRNVISDTWDASWNLLWNEINWLLPPLPPLPPIPPCPSWLCGSAAVDETVMAVAPDAGLDEKPWESVASLLKFQVDAAGDLSRSVGEAMALFVKDLLATGGQAVTDFFEHGLITAATNAVKATWESFVLRSGQAADGFAEYVDAQRDYFSGGKTIDDEPATDETEGSTALAVTAEDDDAADTATKKSDSSRESTDDDEAELSEDAGTSEGDVDLGEGSGELSGPEDDEATPEAQESDDSAAPDDADDSTGADAGESADSES